MRVARLLAYRTPLLVTAALLALVFLTAAQAKPDPVTGGTYTTINPGTDGPGTCENGPGTINCNIYQSKRNVWLNGGPAANSLSPSDGKFFFAVLEPGGQSDANDGSAKNLSDDYDCWQNRVFKLTNGEVSNYPYTGGSPATPLPANCFHTGVSPFQHWLDSGAAPNGRGAPNNLPPLIRLFPYANTGNNGGVYIMAVCSLSTHQPPNIVPSDCKFDAFKVKHDDHTGPKCLLTATVSGPPKQIQVTVEDADSGLERVDYTIWNGTVSPDSGPFTTNPDGSISGSADIFVGMVTPFVLTATKTDQTQGSRLVVTVNDVAGNQTVCDPVVPAAKPLHPLAMFAKLLSLLMRIVPL